MIYPSPPSNNVSQKKPKRKSKPAKRKSKPGPVEDTVDKAIVLYDFSKNPLEAVGKVALRRGAHGVDKVLSHRKRSMAAKKGWDTRRKLYGPKGHT